MCRFVDPPDCLVPKPHPLKGKVGLCAPAASAPGGVTRAGARRARGGDRGGGRAAARGAGGRGSRAVGSGPSSVGAAAAAAAPSMPPPPAPAPPAPAPAPAPPPRKRKLPSRPTRSTRRRRRRRRWPTTTTSPPRRRRRRRRRSPTRQHRCPICQEVFREPLRLPLLALDVQALRRRVPQQQRGEERLPRVPLEPRRHRRRRRRRRQVGRRAGALPGRGARQQQRLEAADQGDQKSRAEIAKAVPALRPHETAARRDGLVPPRAAARCRDYFARLPLELARVDGVARCMCRGRRYVCLVAVSKSEKNFGRKFYKCPRGSNGCKFFRWDE